MKILISLVCLCLLLTTTAQADDKAFNRVIGTNTLRCGYIIWQPYFMKDPNTGAFSGMDHDVFEALGRKLGLKIEWTAEVQSGQEAEALNSGKVDAVCTTVPSNSQSAKFMDFTDGWAYMPFYIYAKKGGKAFTDLKQINSPQVSITGMDGDISLFAADENFPAAKKVAVPSSADPTDINMNVLTGKADLVINDSASLQYFNAANNNMLVPLFADRPYFTIKTCASIKKGEANLRQLLNEGLELMLTEGDTDKVLEKWDPQHKLMKRHAQPYRD